MNVMLQSVCKHGPIMADESASFFNCRARSLAADPTTTPSPKFQSVVATWTPGFCYPWSGPS